MYLSNKNVSGRSPLQHQSDEVILAGSRDVLHNNKNSPTQKRVDDDILAGFSSPIYYALALGFLLSVLFVFQFVSSLPFQNKILDVSSSVKYGGRIVVKNIDNGILNEVAMGLKETGREFLLGAIGGVELSRDNFILSQAQLKSLVRESFNSTRLAIMGNLDLANKRITQINKTFSSNLNINQINKIAQVYAVASSNLDQEVATATLFKIEINKTYDWLFLPKWIAQPSFFPVVFTSYEKKIFPVRTILNTVISTFINTKNSITNSVAIAWSGFFDQIFDESNSVDLSNASLREQLKKEILQELQNGGTATVKAGFLNSTFTDTGIVLLKQSGSNIVDLNNVKNIQDSFSDRVLINFDKEGETGVIQPIFRDRIGEKYIFVITPVKK